ncbi:MAG: hypothetical protein ACYC2G_01170 [Gemmatimonadaceae bacterium]
MKAERLEREFADRAVPYDGGLLLLHPADALALISRAAEEGVPVVVVDGRRVAGDSTDSARDHLRREHFADFAPDVAEGHGCWQAADEFIREHRGPGLVFGLTLGDDPIEAV